MTSNIIVFQTPVEKDTIIHKTENEIKYENYKKNASIPVYHFDLFMEMESINIEKIQSTIPSILIKQILPYCIPIIKELPSFSIKKKTVDIFGKEPNIKNPESYYNITMQYNKPILCKIENSDMLKYTVIPTNTLFSIIGVIIPQNMKLITDKSKPNFILSIPINEILKSGKFGLTEFQDYAYTQERIFNIRPKNKEKKIYFSSDAESLNQIRKIISYINYINNYYEENIISVHNYAKTKYTEKKDYNNAEQLTNPDSLQLSPTYLKNKTLVNLIEQITDSKILGDDYSIQFKLHNSNTINTYNKVKMLGINHENSKKLFQVVDMDKKYNNEIIEYQKNKFKNLLSYAKKKSIALNKFNIQLINLSDTQRKIVNLEFDKMEQYYSVLSKFETDFNIINNLRWAINTGNKKIVTDRLSELYKIIKLPKNLSDPKLMNLLQNKKKINLICPHVVSQAQYMIKSYKNEITKSGQIREHLIKVFSLPRTSDGYFCRICGELLAEIDEDEIRKYIAGKRIVFTVTNDPLKTQIWNDILHIMTSYVKFKNLVNVKKIVTAMTGSMREELGFIESSLIKIKSNTKDSIKNLMSIYISIYTFAMISHMIINNYGSITFTVKPYKMGGKKSDKSSIMKYDDDHQSSIIQYGGQAPKNRIQNIINNALYLILKTKNIYISNVTSITPESVKSILLKAYKWVSSLKTDTGNIKKESISTDGESSIHQDYIYIYIHYIKNMYDYYKGNTNKKKTYTTKDILGREWSKIVSEKNRSIYETLVIPDAYNSGSDTSAKYKYDSFKSMMEYVTNKLYNNFAVPMSFQIKSHTDKYAYLKDMEKCISDTYLKDSLRPFNNTNIIDYDVYRMNDFANKNIKLEKYYDNNGIKHKFDIFIYKNVNSKGVLTGTPREYMKKDIENWLNSHDLKKYNEFKNMIIVDKKCSICNNKLSQVKNNNNISKILQKISDIDVFFNYYENICPMGELHKFTTVSKEEKCSKCGITKILVDKRDKSYYNKYIKIYEKSQKEKLMLEKNNIKFLTNFTKEKRDQKKFSPWKINNVSILELSRVFAIKYNIIINLGLSYGIDYKLLEKEKINPHINVSNDMLIMRNVKLYGYYLQIIRNYNIIKQFEVMVDKYPLLKLIMVKNKVRDLKKILPDIGSIAEKYYFYRDTEDPSLVSNFLLHNISITIMNIYDIFKKHNINVSRELILYIINNILYEEKMLSEPDMNKLKIKSKLDVETDIYQTYDVEDIDDEYGNEEGDVDQGKTLDELGDSDQEDDFSVGDMDIELDNEENLENHHDF